MVKQGGLFLLTVFYPFVSFSGDTRWKLFFICSDGPVYGVAGRQELKFLPLLGRSYWWEFLFTYSGSPGGAFWLVLSRLFWVRPWIGQNFIPNRIFPHQDERPMNSCKTSFKKHTTFILFKYNHIPFYSFIYYNYRQILKD